MSIVSFARVLFVYMFCDFTGRPLQNDHAVDRGNTSKRRGLMQTGVLECTWSKVLHLRSNTSNQRV